MELFGKWCRGKRLTNRELLFEIFGQVSEIADRVEAISLQGEQIMATIDDVIAKLTAEQTVVDSVAVGVDAAVAKLIELRALVAAGGNDPTKNQAALDMIDAGTKSLETKRDELAAAVVEPPVIR